MALMLVVLVTVLAVTVLAVTVLAARNGLVDEQTGRDRPRTSPTNER